MASASIGQNGSAGRFEYANLVPPDGKNPAKWEISKFSDLGRVNVNLEQEINSVEQSLRHAFLKNGGKENREGVMLVGFSTKFRYLAEKSLEELNSLALSAEKVVLDRMVQTRKNIDPRYLVGKGKLREIALHAKHLGADTIIFDTELTPAQANAIGEESGLDIMDRSQLIIQIFAKHAKTNEGKIQARLAEFQYNLPRLKGKGTAFSQLGGGIGTRGPGEKKLEQERRSIRKQIEQLEKQIDSLCRRREHTRKNRKTSMIPTLSFIGYTNVGKSTLFNRLTKSSIVTQDKLFSTLNPTTRRVMLPGGKHVLMTDTVGFISKLPKELINAFRATLEEIGEADLLLHVADASDPEVREKIDSVIKIVESMEFEDVPSILLFNKVDQADADTEASLREAFPQVPFVSARNGRDFKELLLYIEKFVEETDADAKLRNSNLGEELKGSFSPSMLHSSL
ncbi:MAG: GTPase HflX [Candidatus Dadabacteria bacterium]|nr:GTPase HflX [Candidatus Dadabacteria bacterium]MYA47730.1 GTPase HflX [Candidatus Dadabacteria bacterium]MYG83210.1 GTPase HflX [Candidatus Dadabacteria bacterium]MYK50102.1 GTPase HflX [Candidatus Dadabacteria bacterium]